MTARTRAIWDSAFTGYDFGDHHPMAPLRLDLTARLCRALGLFDIPDLSWVGAQVAPLELLARVHDRDYLAAVQSASADPFAWSEAGNAAAQARFGVGTDDVPAFAGMHAAAARVVQATTDLAAAVWRGELDHGVNFCGGLHHAQAGRASGFCIYNDLAVAISWLLDHGAQRVAYIDVDVHHGDGVEKIFWDDPRVLTVSVHESGRDLFPGTGYAADVGGPEARGAAINLALPAGTDDRGWLLATEQLIPRVVRGFRPEIIISQHGCDTHSLDPLAHLSVSMEAQVRIQNLVHDLSHEVCSGRWVATGGGGYEVVDVVPRSWAHLVGIAAHRPVSLADRVPPQWTAAVQALVGRPGPAAMGDPMARAEPRPHVLASIRESIAQTMAQVERFFPADSGLG
ncbi:MAG: acetoin utilization protein AcuC [Angustibacter sp.]